MDKFVDVQGVKTRYREQGTGPALVLLHGASLGSSAEVWDDLLEPLAGGGLRVLALDLLGYGLTGAPSQLTPGYQREHLREFLNAMHLDRAYLVGHSMSGGVCARLALEQPERVVSLTVVGTGSLLPPLPGVTTPPEAEPLPDTEPSLDATRADLAANAFHSAELAEERIVRRHQLSTGANFLAAQARTNAPREPREDPPLSQRLDSLPVPSLFIYGEQDRGHAADRARLARQRFPNLNLHILPECKHLVPWDQPEALVRLIQGFVASVSASGATADATPAGA